ncbi:unnamed protein product [Leptidea sinapis]|uniref:PKD/Chitinase domain-containing protein n=1 Tax=Leptidea sinapis TaxID=189913 RepID=A0A5E4QTZ8_9NEOP|nr:unnamed protein product [Leptidea sinapis]
MSCCIEETCNIVFIVDTRCYHVECVTDELCLPLPRSGRKWDGHVSMILVKPVLPEDEMNSFPQEEEPVYAYSNRNELANSDESDFLTHFIKNLPNIEETPGFDKYSDNNNNEMMLASRFLEKVACEVGADDCPYNSECIPLGLKMHSGICKCTPGMEMNNQGSCVPIRRVFSKGPRDESESSKTNEEVIGDMTNEDVKEPKPVQKLTVSISSKTVQLPENEVTLAAYTIPDENSTNSHYNYVWILVNQPKDKFTGNMKQNGGTVTLTDLTEGQYSFKVTVNGTNSYGEGFANVTVLPPHRINKPPVVFITPQSQVVKLPISRAPTLEDRPTLVLNDLKQPGHYTFKLTVEDTDHVKNSTVANITVSNHIDYPPEANADSSGQTSTAEVHFISLPQTWIVLNGTGSHDDNKIVSFTWRCLSGPNNATIVNFNESVANATGLTKGVYVFSLTVIDDNANVATENVTITVTQNKNSPPKADAGGDQVLNLPLAILVLNGSKSHDDFRIVSWKWTRLASGLAAGSVILDSDKGPLTVMDDQGESDRDTVSVQVKPDPLEANLLEMTINTPISAFTKNQLDSMVQKMTLLLKDDVLVNVTEIRDWSVVYAGVGVVVILLVWWGCWRLARALCSRRKPRTKTNYRLLPLAEHDDKPFVNKDVSETDTDSDVLYETKSKITSFSSRPVNGDAQANGWKRNGTAKVSRKIKT